MACNELYAKRTCFGNLYYEKESDLHACRMSTKDLLLEHCFKIDVKESEQNSNYFIQVKDMISSHMKV